MRLRNQNRYTKIVNNVTGRTGLVNADIIIPGNVNIAIYENSNVHPLQTAVRSIMSY